MKTATFGILKVKTKYDTPDTEFVPICPLMSNYQ